MYHHAGPVCRPTATAMQKYSAQGLVKEEALIPRLRSLRTAEALANTQIIPDSGEPFGKM